MTSAPASPAEQVIGLYDRHARDWAQVRTGSRLEEPWLQRFTALLPPNGRVLDVGCGSGEPIARFLIEAGFAVTGSDSSSRLIELCRESLPQGEWHAGDMRALDLGETFDGVIAWHSFFHLVQDDQRAMFPRFAAHTSPGGLLLFTSGEESGERIAEWQDQPLYHASLAPDEYEALLRENGFRLLERRLRDPQCGGASVWLAQMRPARGLDGSA